VSNPYFRDLILVFGGVVCRMFLKFKNNGLPSCKPYQDIRSASTMSETLEYLQKLAGRQRRGGSTSNSSQYKCIFHHTPIPGTSVYAVIFVSRYCPAQATFRWSELDSYQLSETGLLHKMFDLRVHIKVRLTFGEIQSVTGGTDQTSGECSLC